MQVHQEAAGCAGALGASRRGPTGRRLGTPATRYSSAHPHCSPPRATPCRDVQNISPAKQQQHLDNIKREAAVLRKLRGTLNVCHVEEVFEDAEHVHIVGARA